MCERKISNLKYSDLLKLADLLENETKHHNWNYLGKCIVKQKNDLTIHQIDFLKHGYREEESASWIFLQSLRTNLTSCSIETIQSIALSFKRNDIFLHLNNVQDKSINVWDLSYEKQIELVYYLEKDTTTLPDWKMFADELGYSYSEIKAMAPTKRQYERPTILLFNLLISKYPSTDVSEIITVFQGTNRLDVIELLNRTL